MLKSQEDGFIRLQIDVIQSKISLIISEVILEKQRLVLAKWGKDVAAIIPDDEFERLEWLRYDIQYGQFQLDEEYDDDESGIPCISINELEFNFDCILAQVMDNDEIFGLTFPTASFEDNNENFISGAILMNINNFWIPDYWLNK
ncbi:MULTISPECIES: type II toxin-antitoxin system Phd/YefM family antitoxin [unclassified Anabaena]|uniref:type II toxin-antitoxin system Phd/YefM family antitoxin n=1 Tax=unclassified Anabaena TaxID=2619674 RepID=UPI001445B5F4|nr:MULTISPECIES: type II toxin-antitoxin system Phd/YefM family antitoxin [unclassified Anabaena]MTJ07743.1 type II toxin-antitoxin system Phd/YefM family antitoxin [Anabaena sp. UHCC 0204]MTJ51751.1 type II toxin-antitoxin system Phd/YefM family antitoxin [Anabaena sp. UHCC 0253]